MTPTEIVALCTLGGIALAFLRWGRPRLRNIWRKGGAVVATLIGTDEVRHKITGEIIQPAQPGVGVQVAELSRAVTKLVDQQAHTEALQGQVHDLDRRVTTLEEAREERLASYEDSTAAWGAIAAAHNSTPDDAA